MAATNPLGEAMVYTPTEDPGAQKLSNWIAKAQQRGWHTSNVGWNTEEAEHILAWLEYGKKEGILALVTVPSEDTIRSLKKRFQMVRLWLLTLLIGCSALLAVGTTILSFLPVYLAAFAGLAGSSTAGLISCLNRRANGFEDDDGNTCPDPASKKERFNAGMAEWLMTRPALGLFMGLLVYFGISGKVIDSPAITNNGQVFWSAVAGLFSKTLYDLLLGFLKVLVPGEGG